MCDTLWLEPGTELDVCELEDGSGLELKVAPMEFKRVRRGRGFVLEPSRPLQPLTTDHVREMIEHVREEPLRRVLDRMRTSPDSSVLIAGCATWHPMHALAIDAIEATTHLIGHCALETFSVLTRMPGDHRIDGRTVADCC